MASFLLNASVSGVSVFGFRLGNLLLHLATGLAIFTLLLMLARRDRLLSAFAVTTAFGVTAIWLLHPMLVSTVLYVIQRMAMLSAFFMILTMLAYVHGRTRFEAGCFRTGSAWLFLAVPALTALAAFSKENGVLAPVLCGVIEWVYFAPRIGGRRPWQVRVFLILGIFVPAIMGLALLLSRPDLFLEGYTHRSFTLVERVLTQARVLFDYAHGLLLPYGPSFSLYRDDYPISTGWMSPATTLLAWSGWAAIITLIFVLRKRVPGYSAGMAIFLVGHLVESSIIPLMIYFEHRNYLPGVGLLWALASLVAWFGKQLRCEVGSARVLWPSALAALLIVLSAAAFFRADLWSTPHLLLTQSLERYPNSRSLRLELAYKEMSRTPPNVKAAQQHYHHLMSLESSSTQLIGAIGLIISNCYAQKPIAPGLVSKYLSRFPETMEADVIRSLENLAAVVRQMECKGLTPDQLADGLVNALKAADLKPGSIQSWRMRLDAARLYYDSGQMAKALEQAEIAWQNGHDLNVGLMVAGLRINLGMNDAARELLSDLETRIPASHHEQRARFRSYIQALETEAFLQ
ncbi:MAG: hypothetical protein LC637_08390 [Xanthomonadaceae bacterium]|nr:hypothetical protein [Xanthomonadaceae bacterium]